MLAASCQFTQCNVVESFFHIHWRKMVTWKSWNLFSRSVKNRKYINAFQLDQSKMNYLEILEGVLKMRSSYLPNVFDIYLVNVKTIRQIVQIFVTFLEEKPVFNPITFSENSNYCWEKRWQPPIFAFTPQANFPIHFHWSEGYGIESKLPFKIFSTLLSFLLTLPRLSEISEKN